MFVDKSTTIVTISMYINYISGFKIILRHLPKNIIMKNYFVSDYFTKYVPFDI